MSKRAASALQSIDLSSLGNFKLSDVGSVKGAAEGAPLDLPIEQIGSDPLNARTEFDDASLQELAANIAERGLLEPISVRTDPQRPGYYFINSGERRWRASKLAGKETIRAFVDDAPDEFDRFNVNEARENLSPMDKARFFERHRLAGMSLEAIGERLSPRRSKAYIHQHLALLKLPPVLAELYARDVCRNVTALAELSRLHRQNAEFVEQALRDVGEVPGSLVRDLAEAIKGGGTQAEAGGAVEVAAEKIVEAPGVTREATAEASEAPSTATAEVEASRPSAFPMKIVVKFEGKRYSLRGTFVTDRVPSMPGNVFVAKGRGDPFEVEVSALELDAITVKV